MTPENDAVFLLDVDNALVDDGHIVTNLGGHPIRNPGPHATNRQLVYTGEELKPGAPGEMRAHRVACKPDNPFANSKPKSRHQLRVLREN
jgi:hypothetical protein